MNDITCTSTLPEGYVEKCKVNLQKDKKPALIVNLLALLIALVCIVIGRLIVPIDTLFDTGDNTYFVRLGVMIVGMIAYVFLHEAVHGICMKYFGSKTVHYGFTGLYAYAGCNDYFAKKPYIIIALAPIVVWGVVLLLLSLFVHGAWFWVVYAIQIINISGAAGDLYVSWLFRKMDADILIRDTGVAMTVYSKQ